MEYLIGFLASFTGFMLVFFFSTSIPQAIVPVLIGVALSLIVLRYYLRGKGKDEVKSVVRNYFLMFFLGALVSSISMFNLLLFVVSVISLKMVWDSK